MLKVRDWTTRKSRDFNEEYPKLRFALNPDLSTASMFCAVVFTHLSVSKLYVLFLFCISHKPSVYVKSSLGLPLFVCLSVSPLSLLLGLHPRIFSHPNVLPMLGACQSPPAPHPIIITHWMPYGSLYNVLHEGTSEYFCSGHKVRTCHHFLVVCRDLLIYCTYTFVIMLPSLYVQ